MSEGLTAKRPRLGSSDVAEARAADGESPDRSARNPAAKSKIVATGAQTGVRVRLFVER
jgi:hypothetical protein